MSVTAKSASRPPPRARAASQAIGRSGARRRRAAPRPVGALALDQRAVDDRLVAALAQLLHHFAGDPGALVGGHGDLHARRMPRSMTTVDPGIFKAYDVRGLYGDQIDGEVAEQVGRAFARVLGGLSGKPTTELRVGVGRDMRLS